MLLLSGIQQIRMMKEWPRMVLDFSFRVSKSNKLAKGSFELSNSNESGQRESERRAEHKNKQIRTIIIVRVMILSSL